MRFHDVNRKEANLVLVLIVELVEGGNLPPKWRSGITPEDEHHWLMFCREGGELHPSGFVESLKREIRCGVAVL